MDLRFYIDPETGRPHFETHGISEDEIANIMSNPDEDRRGREGCRMAIGRTEGGRVLRVIYVPDAERKASFVVTAYELTTKQLQAFRRRMKKKGK